MGSCEVEAGRRVMARLPHGGDLYEEILAVARAHGINLGEVWAIGAVQRARIAYYNQKKQAYRTVDLDEPLEIVSLLGTVSLLDGAPTLHAHGVFADQRGRTRGGHLVAGCVIFACELCVTELMGQVLERGRDDTTGLPLWQDL